ncbi:MAG: APC family permease [Gammaproteobacteria bacterium]
MHNDEPLLRQLSVSGIWLLAVNGMIGAGIFGVPAGAAALTGIYSPLVFLGCGFLLTAVVLCFAEIASYFRGTGGPMLYLRAAFGSHAGFQAGWAFYIARATAFAANMNLLVASVAFFWRPAEGGAGRIFLLGLVVLLLAVPNVAGTRHGMRSLGLLTVLKLLPLLALVAVGLAWLQPAAFPVTTTALPGYTSFGMAALLVIYAFVGWEGAVVPAGEARNPARDMPRGLILAMVVVTILYVLVQAVAVAVLPDLAASERALVDVGAVLFGPAGAILLTAAVVVSVAGNLAGTMLSAPRMTYALARDGSLPAWFGQVHPSTRTPMQSIIFFSVLVFLLGVYGSFVWLAAMSALVRVLIYMACIGAMPRLRRRFGDSPGSFRVPGGWVTAAGAFVVSGLLLLQVRLDAVLVTGAFLLAGAVLYWLVRRGIGPASEEAQN